MLDRFAIKIIKKPLESAAILLDKCNISANQMTVIGFVMGCITFPSLIFQSYHLALIFIGL